MKHYSKEFKEEALKLSDEIGVKKAAQQLGIAYYTLADWRSIRRNTPPAKTPSAEEQTMNTPAGMVHIDRANGAR